MFFIYLGKNGCGKTHKLMNEYEKNEKDKIFFPCASEILSMINGEQNKNCQGMIGTKDYSKKYENAIIKVIKLISKKQKTDSERNIESIVDKINKATNEFQKEITKELENIFDDSDDHECKYANFKNELIKSYVHYDIP